ncbi:hypothetical protein BU16DRAFT_533731 [Lophium mytilinum]|uniref:Uncharacterized protein n=1 Tax=Lophium mytilinum TaxID=390894 RepID=A0A6A6R9E2_9PEZI|nr:hypothetical protein BU16DRAFT_533731 [Lophium mytilinum]
MLPVKRSPEKVPVTSNATPVKAAIPIVKDPESQASIHTLLSASPKKALIMSPWKASTLPPFKLQPFQSPFATPHLPLPRSSSNVALSPPTAPTRPAKRPRDESEVLSSPPATAYASPTTPRQPPHNNDLRTRPRQEKHPTSNTHGPSTTR